jgi:hypothetical protein
MDGWMGSAQGWVAAAGAWGRGRERSDDLISSSVARHAATTVANATYTNATRISTCSYRRAARIEPGFP